MNSTKIQKQSTYRGISSMLLCATLWSTSGLFFKLVPWNSILISGGRGIFAAIVIVLMMKFYKFKFIFNKKSITGATFTALTALTFVMANKYTTSANAIALQYTEPMFMVILLAIINKKLPEKKDTIFVLITFLGMLLFFIDQLETGAIFGNCVGLLSGMLMSLEYMSLGRCNEQERLNAHLLSYILQVIISIPFFVMDRPVVNPKILAAIVYLGIVQMGITSLLFNYAMNTCDAFMCSMLSLLEPLLNPIWVFIFTGELPGTFAIIGFFIVLYSVSSWSVIKAKDMKEQEDFFS